MSSLLARSMAKRVQGGQPAPQSPKPSPPKA